jgi:hypothetical protein
MSPRRIQQLAAVLLAAVVVVAAARDEPAGKNYQTQWDTVMSILNCKSDSLIPSYICSVISKSRWGWGSDDPADDYTPAAAARPLRSTADLPKYVDALPQMPKILGYGIGPFGFPVPINLTIGMYHTTWVCYQVTQYTAYFFGFLISQNCIFKALYHKTTNIFYHETTYKFKAAKYHKTAYLNP